MLGTAKSMPPQTRSMGFIANAEISNGREVELIGWNHLKLYERFHVVLKGHNNDGIISSSRNYDRRMILADLLHSFSKILPCCGVRYGFHDFPPCIVQLRIFT